MNELDSLTPPHAASASQPASGANALVPAAFAEKAMGSLMQLHTELV